MCGLEEELLCLRGSGFGGARFRSFGPIHDSFGTRKARKPVQKGLLSHRASLGSCVGPAVLSC